MGSRRQFLQTALGAASAAACEHYTPPKSLPQGQGPMVLIAGGGPCGLTTALRLLQQGRRVLVFEASDRVGGRTLTVRRGDVLKERNGKAQACRFEPGQYLNAGAGRLPHYHNAIVDLCRELRVPLEPFIFNCRENRLRSDSFWEGNPVAFRHFEHELRGHVSNLLAVCTQADADLAKLVAKDPKRYGQVDAEQFREMLQHFGDLREVAATTPELCESQAGSKTFRYCGTDRVGYDKVPGAGNEQGEVRSRIPLSELLQSELADDQIFADLRVYWQSSHMQPVGGMDQIARYLAQAVGEEKILLGHVVKRVVAGENGVQVTVQTPAGDQRTFEGSHLVSAIAPKLYADDAPDGRIENNFPSDVQHALSHFQYNDACKVGWQSRRRFWEEEHMYGGISWTNARVSQIWYPSSEFHSSAGTLTGAYNRGEPALAFGKLSVEDRIEEAWLEGTRMHPGSFAHWVEKDKGLAIAWQNMPHQVGGWAKEVHEQKLSDYQLLQKPVRGRTYFAGDYMSHTPGWLEGAVRSAAHVANEIAGNVPQPPRS